MEKDKTEELSKEALLKIHQGKQLTHKQHFITYGYEVGLILYEYHHYLSFLKIIKNLESNV